MLLDFSALFRASGKRVRTISRGLSISGFGKLGIETAQWLRAANDKYRWEVRTGDHERYGRMIVGRIAPDRTSILDFVYLSVVPRTNCNFRLTDRMLKEEPRGGAAEIAAIVISNQSSARS
jgi:hypothetical protein